MTSRHLLILLVGLCISIPLLAKAKIEIDSEILNGKLIPTVIINNHTVIKITSKGGYKTDFERADKIYSVLQDIQEDELDLSKIKVRRYKKEYTASIGRIRLYSTTAADAKPLGTTARKLAQEWAENIKEAIAKPVPAPLPTPPTKFFDQSKNKNGNPALSPNTMFPLLNLIGVSNETQFIGVVLSILFLLLTQTIIAIAVVVIFQKKRPIQKREILKIKHALETNKKEIINIIQQLQEIRSKLNK